MMPLSTADALGQVAFGKYQVTMHPWATYEEVKNIKNGKKSYNVELISKISHQQ